MAQAERELAAPKTAKESHKLQQRYGGYGGYYGGYGGYGGYYSGYGGYDNYGYYGDESGRQFDDYGNEITEAEDTGDAIPEGEEVIKPLDYYENMIYGIIDGTSGDFDTNCRDSLYGIVGGGFAAYKYKNVAKPTNTIKFQMGINQFTDSTNSVYTYCDFSHLFNQLAMLTDWENWEQYI